MATLNIITRRLPAGDLADGLHDRLGTGADVLAGISALPNGCGVALRALGHSSAAVSAAMRLAWNEARLALTGIPAPDLRKG